MQKSSKNSELRALEERNALLESLSDVGVALAGSFDIRAILHTTHDAAARLSESPAVDVLYIGCHAINSKPMWYPAEPSAPGLTQEDRDDLLARARAEPGSRPDLEVGDRRCVPLDYQSERLGYLFFLPPEDEDVALAFSVVGVSAPTTKYTITSAPVVFSEPSTIGINPDSHAGISLLPDANGGSLTGLHAGGHIVQARYNGTSVYADLVDSISTTSSSTVGASEQMQSGGINETVNSIELEYFFELTAGDLAFGTGVFKVEHNPEPSAVVLVVLGLLPLCIWRWRRRRQA